MNFPKIQKGQYAVFKANVEPASFLGLGPQLDIEHSRWRIFNTLAAAHKYASAQVAAHPCVECGIYDARESHVHSVRV
jgi:hypothetical protein